MHHLVEAICSARAQHNPVVLMMGGHPVKLGLSRYLIDLVERGWLSHVACNGSALIHDFELALVGGPSEDVAKWLPRGQFGLWRETGRLNDVIRIYRRRTAWERFLLNRPRPQQPPTSHHLGEQNEQAADLRALIDAFVSILPAVQGTALTVFLEHYPDSRATRVLLREVVRQTGQATTLGAVKRAMLVGPGKLRRFLSEHGYELVLDGAAALSAV